MPATRVYQCPGCGETIATRKDASKYQTCPKCHTRGLISKHSIATPMTIARKKHAKDKATATREAGRTEAPFTKDQLLGRIEMAKEAPAPQTNDQDEYHCKECDHPLTKGDKHCPGCGAKLDWSQSG